VSEPQASERPSARPPPVGAIPAAAPDALAASIEARHELREPAQRQERLRSIVAQLLTAAAERGQALGGVRVAGVSVPPQPRAGARPPMLVTVEGGRRIAVEVGNERSPHFALKRLHRLVEERDADAGVLLRESAAPLGAGVVTRELLAALGPGAVVWLEREPVRRLVGAELLLDAVAASEISVGDRPATRAEALGHLLERPELAAALAPALGGVVPSRLTGEELAERVFGLLTTQGPILSLARVAAALEVPEPVLEPAVRELTARGRAMIQPGRQGQTLLVLLRGAT
jgi:hypothetical protein